MPNFSGGLWVIVFLNSLNMTNVTIISLKSEKKARQAYVKKVGRMTLPPPLLHIRIILNRWDQTDFI